MSDSHGDVDAAAAAVRLCRREGVDRVIHCGDITTPAVITLLEGYEVHWVLGNCDFDRDGLEQAMLRAGHRCHGEAGVVEVAGLRLAFTHGHRTAQLEALWRDPANDLVLHGHSHQPRNAGVGRRRLLNPGALHRAAPTTLMLLDGGRAPARWLELLTGHEVRVEAEAGWFR